MMTARIQSVSPAFPLLHADAFKAFSSLRRMAISRPPLAAHSRWDFIRDLTLHFPEVASNIEESDFGIIHLEVGVLRIATRQAILCHDFTTARKHFGFVGRLLTQADRELGNALRISYLEHLFLGENGLVMLEARKLLSEFLEAMLRQAEHRASPGHSGH